MVEILGFDTGLNFANGGGGMQLNWVLILIIFLFLIVGVIVLYLVYRMRVYNKKVIVFENISGQGYQPVLRDKARLIKIGDAGEEILYLSKKKVYRTAYGRKMGKNTYWFAIGQDGYWYNIVLGDLDAKMGMLDIEPIDRDMRYMHVAVRKNIQDRYRKVKFMEKYGGVVLSGVFLLIMLIGIWLLLDKIGDIAGSINTALESSKIVIDQAGNMLSSVDNICAGGTGITPVL